MVLTLLLIALALWAGGVGFGFARLLVYANTPEASGASPACWPADVNLELDPARANLLLFAHPHCPCTRASLSELERLLTRCQGLATVHVLFYRPGTFPENWDKTDLWRRAAALPGARVVSDEDGAIARRLGATTSGHVLVFDRAGDLVFRGGITNARGHAGASAGADAIHALLTRERRGLAETPVFGCPLRGPHSREGEGGDQSCCP